MGRGAEEVGAVLTKLRVAKRQELIMAISDLDTIEECPIDTGEELVISLLLRTSVNTTL